MDKSALEQLLSTYNWWMGVSTVAVAIGILGEYVAHFIFEKEARENKPEIFFSILFGILVLGGVVGEYRFGSKLSGVAGQLQTRADIEVAELNKEAATATERASKAEENLGNAKREAAKADEHSAVAEQRAAEANRIAEEERLARVKIEATVAWRRLSAAQQADLGTTMLQYRVLSHNLGYSGEAETQQFANDIANALKGSGWQVGSPSRFWLSPVFKVGEIQPTMNGVAITVLEGDILGATAGKVLVKKLMSFGYDAELVTAPKPAGEVARLGVMIYPRPEGPQGEWKLNNEAERRKIVKR